MMEETTVRPGEGRPSMTVDEIVAALSRPDIVDYKVATVGIRNPRIASITVMVDSAPR